MNCKNGGRYILVVLLLSGLTACKNDLNYGSNENKETICSEVITNYENPKSLNRESNVDLNSKTEDLKVQPIYDFFNCYFNTYTKSEIQDFSEILQDNDETFLFINFLKYQLYKQLKNQIYWNHYSFELTDINKQQDQNKLLISVICEVEFTLKDAKDASEAVIPYKFTLKQTDDKWMITNIEEDSGMPNFLASFKDQIDNLVDENKTRHDNIKNATQYLIDNYE